MTMPLQTGFSFYYMRRSKNSKNPINEGSQTDESAVSVANSKAEAFTDAVKKVATVNNVDEFWTIYDHIMRPDKLPVTTDYHFFREGIAPTWEDPANANGGKWTLRLPKKGILASRLWEEVVLALVGAQFSGVPDGEVCGAVISVREKHDVLAVWTKSGKNQQMINKVGQSLRRILSLPTHAFHAMYYQTHPRPSE